MRNNTSNASFLIIDEEINEEDLNERKSPMSAAYSRSETLAHPNNKFSDMWELNQNRLKGNTLQLPRRGVVPIKRDMIIYEQQSEQEKVLDDIEFAIQSMRSQQDALNRLMMKNELYVGEIEFKIQLLQEHTDAYKQKLDNIQSTIQNIVENQIILSKETIIRDLTSLLNSVFQTSPYKLSVPEKPTKKEGGVKFSDAPVFLEPLENPSPVARQHRPSVFSTFHPSKSSRVITEKSETSERESRSNTDSKTDAKAVKLVNPEPEPEHPHLKLSEDDSPKIKHIKSSENSRHVVEDKSDDSRPLSASPNNAADANQAQHQKLFQLDGSDEMKSKTEEQNSMLELDQVNKSFSSDPPDAKEKVQDALSISDIVRKRVQSESNTQRKDAKYPSPNVVTDLDLPISPVKQTFNPPTFDGFTTVVTTQDRLLTLTRILSKPSTKEEINSMRRRARGTPTQIGPKFFNYKSQVRGAGARSNTSNESDNDLDILKELKSLKTNPLDSPQTSIKSKPQKKTFNLQMKLQPTQRTNTIQVSPPKKKVKVPQFLKKLLQGPQHEEATDVDTNCLMSTDRKHLGRTASEGAGGQLLASILTERARMGHASRESVPVPVIQVLPVHDTKQASTSHNINLDVQMTLREETPLPPLPFLTAELPELPPGEMLPPARRRLGSKKTMVLRKTLILPDSKEVADLKRNLFQEYGELVGSKITLEGSLQPGPHKEHNSSSHNNY